ncbi:hypothetical protein ACFL0V_04740 [Nanoarchaeota archaeon]
MAKIKYNLRWWRILLTAFLYAIIAQVIHSISALLSMSFYTDEKHFALWSNIMMPGQGSPGVEFYLVSFVFALIVGFIFSLIYALFRESLPGKSTAIKGLFYGLILFALGQIPAFFMTYLILAVPTLLLVIWAVEGLIILLVTGMVIAALNK